LVIALLLSIIPLPLEWRWWRPEFVALLVIYWATYSPEYFGVFYAWVFGILLDVIELSPVGYHSIGLIVVAYISHLSYQRIRSYVVWQQAAWVFVLVGIYQLFCNWASGFMGKSIEGFDFLIAAVITAFLWPLLVVMLRTIKIYWRIP
jgi:rod shape-determining protein MreD